MTADRQYIPDYAGLVTFARAPSVTIADVPAGSFAVLGVPIDSWVLARPGQRWGPRRIREQSLHAVGYFYRPSPGYLNLATGDLLTLAATPLLYDVGDVPVFQTDQVAQTAAIAEMVSAIVQRGATAILLGGDHVVPYPGVTGFVQGLQVDDPDVKIGYLHVDSHLDFVDDMGGFLGRLNHATSTRRISENPAVKNMVWYGLNGGHTEIGQFDELRRRGFVAYDVAAVRRRGAAAAMREALDRVCDGVDAVYVSLDVDVMDGAYAPGTHSVVVDGLTSPEYLAAMGVLADYPKVRAFDVCEVLPAHDTAIDRTSRLAALGIFAWTSRALFDAAPKYTPEDISEVFIR